MQPVNVLWVKNLSFWFLFSHFPETELSKLLLCTCSEDGEMLWSNLPSLRKVEARDFIVQGYMNLVGLGVCGYFCRTHSVLQVSTILLGSSPWDNLSSSSVLLLRTFHLLRPRETSKAPAVGTVLNLRADAFSLLLLQQPYLMKSGNC